MEDSFLLSSPLAARLYENYASGLPIIDYHNHLSVTDIAGDRRYGSITELWISADPYKHRLMRICGVSESVITGECDPYDKFKAFCAIFPYLCGTAVYDFSMLELRRVFNIEELPTAENAERLYCELNERLASPEFSTRGILARFGVEYQSPIASVCDGLSGYGEGVAPSLRGDSLIAPTADTARSLGALTGSNVLGLEDFLAAAGRRIDDFAALGCRFADHSIDEGFAYTPEDGKADDLFKKSLCADLTPEEKNALSSAILRRLAPMYARKNMTLLLHLGAKRHTSDRLARLAGPFGGYAAIGTTPTPGNIADMLGDFERWGGLPRTVLFPLNMSHMPALASLGGSFSEDGVSGKVQLGPAWWWCDHPYGIRATLDAQSSFGVLSEFIGMTTDSRSPLSFSRHEYFRRILCSYLAELSEAGRAPRDERLLSDIIRKVCYSNAKSRTTLI